MSNQYCDSLVNYKRYETREVKIGSVSLGGKNPIRLQSMTTADTMDTQSSVDESIRMIEAGCEIVRLTAPSKKDAENLANIKEHIRNAGYDTPLVADIHFTPNAAEIAAKIVEKVRVNPGNYADKKKFETIDYTDESYQAELDRIRGRFTPLVLLCKEHGTAMRIGTNHGSLSDRILSRYGDTPEGMVASAMEFINICADNDYHNLVISMKASNPQVMVQAYRLLVANMREIGMNYPLHLGVTEAGEGEDGRIKSAVGIGTLLEDGIGDTIRVSLTEAPENEIPVARILAERYSNRNGGNIPEIEINDLPYSPFEYQRRDTSKVGNIGNGQVPVVFADLSNIDTIKPSHFFGFGYNYSVPLDKWNLGEQAADYVYLGTQSIDFEIPGTVGVVQEYRTWKESSTNKERHYPIIEFDAFDSSLPINSDLVFVRVQAEDIIEGNIAFSKLDSNSVIVLQSDSQHWMPTIRLACIKMMQEDVDTPVVFKRTLHHADRDTVQLYTGTDFGGLLLDGMGDGVWLSAAHQSTQLINATQFGVLQATRTRISKTEYISCPSCGRTLFDLQETTAKIRAKTDHLKGLKIGIMGCIVNGPGEMADADYGYVGTGPGKITLYKEKEVVQRNIQESEAVDALIELIKSHGDWVDA